ncbi:MAG TPA: hypothetical protein VIJ52_00710 [Pseudolabrys sp.]
MSANTLADLEVDRDIARATSARYVRYAAKCIEQSDEVENEDAAVATALAKEWRAKAAKLDEEIRMIGFAPQA